MGKAVRFRGTLTDRSHIELLEPIDDLHGEVEVVVRSLEPTSSPANADVLDFLGRLRPGT